MTLRDITNSSAQNIYIYCHWSQFLLYGPYIGAVNTARIYGCSVHTTRIYSMVNFGPLAAEIVSLVRGTPATVNGFRVLAALLHGTLVVGVSETLRR